MLFTLRVDADYTPWKRDPTGFTCSKGSIADLDKIPDNATKIVIYNMPVGRITPFLRFSRSLEELLCRNCSITEIEDNASNEMTKLKSLDLNNNNLTRVKAKWFENPVSLEVITFINNKIYDIDEDAFSKLTKLRLLTVLSNYETTVKAKWFKNTTSLRILDLAGNKIDHIEKCTFCKKNLRRLYLEYNSLKNVKGEWYGNSGFPKFFYLHNNKINEFDASAIEKLKNVSGLDISGNYLECSSIQNIVSGSQSSSEIAITRNMRCNDQKELQKFAEKKRIKILEYIKDF